jgi:hypothetical protein
MSIGYKKQTSASVPTPSSSESNTFVDSADGRLKRKESNGSIVDIEAAATGVTTFEGRNGAVVSAPGDYNASEITNVPSGGISATNVQAAINELDGDKVNVSHVGSRGASQHDVATVLEAGFMSPTDKDKLDNIQAGATANQTNSYLLARANHTGTQSAATITGLAAVATSGDKTDVGLGNVDDTADMDKPVSTAQAAADSAAIATAEAYSIQRSNHTGTQTASTISDFNTSADARADARITAQKATANGLATLDGSGKIPSSQLTLDATQYKGTWSASANTPSLVDGTGNTGDFYKVSTTGTQDLGSGPITFQVGELVIYNGSVWERVGSNDAVSSVAGKTGVVTLVKADVGLSNVDNTSDVNKPVSTAQAAADAAVQAYAIQRANHTGTQSAATITGLAAVATSGDKADVGLGNVDNTSDANKPVSTAQAAADSAVQAYAVQRANHTGTQAGSTVTVSTPSETYGAVVNGDTVQVAIEKLIYMSCLVFRDITVDVTVPTGADWFRGSTRIAGTAKLRAVGTAKLRFL